MEIFLSVRDIFNFAIRIEEDGEAFYSEASKTANDIKIKELFGELALEETKHREKFKEMLSKTKEDTPHETYEGEYLAYLKDHISGKVIFTKGEKNKIPTLLNDPISVLDFAIEREFDSITYYQEMGSFIQQKYRGEIEAIIKEERGHFLKLSEVKKNIKGNR